MPRPNINSNYGKARDTKGSLIKLSKYLKPHILFIVLAISLSICGTICMILGPKFLGDITKYTQNFIANNSYDPRSDIIRTAIILIFLYSSSATCNYFSGFFMTGVTQKITNRMRNDISVKINKIPLSYFDSRSFGDVLSRVTNDIDMIGQNLNQTLSQFISSIVMFFGVFTMMLIISPSMTLIAVITIPLSLIIMIFLIKISQKYFRAQQKALGNLNGHIEEAYSGQNVIKVFNQEDEQFAIFDKMNKELKYTGWKSQFLSSMMMPLMSFVGNLSFTSICVVGGLLSMTGTYGLEIIQQFIQYTRQLNQPIQQIGQMGTVIQQCAAASERVFEFLSEEELPAENVITKLENDKVVGNVEFRNVNFGYTEDRQIIFDFNCQVKAGQKIAIVGPTGAGKTTLVNLLMRFYEVGSGEILIDGISTKDISRENVASLFGMVLQDTWLFEGTLRDNLKFGNPNATDEDIMQALKACHMDHFVNSLTGGLDYVFTESANVSAGQKQLLTIARTMIENAPMLILDEATSSVDTRTELLIQNAMDKLMENRTSFVIAHRLSTIKNADIILVLKDGNVVEQGNHEKLLAKGGFYASLYNSQFDM